MMGQGQVVEELPSWQDPIQSQHRPQLCRNPVVPTEMDLDVRGAINSAGILLFRRPKPEKKWDSGSCGDGGWDCREPTGYSSLSTRSNV